MSATASAQGLARLARDPRLLDALGDLATAAGAVIMGFRHRVRAEAKHDGSPVTEADQRAEEAILAGLAALLPGIPVVSEEAVSAGHIPPIGDDFVLVDALDGTKEFVAGDVHFTVNIALVHRGRPVAGVVYAPAMRKLWLAGVRAEAMAVDPGARVATAAGRRTIHVRPLPAGALVAMSSLRHHNSETDAFLRRFPIAEHERAGSSIKFCHLAEGQADLYPRLSPTMEWDTAAGHAVVAAAGGEVVTLDGQPLRYGRSLEGFRNPPFVAASNWAGCVAKRRA